MRSELREVYEYDPVHVGEIDWKLVGMVVVFIAFMSVVLYTMFYHGHQVSIGLDQWTNTSVEWSVPYGSPEIGIREDGSVGSLMDVGRISMV